MRGTRRILAQIGAPRSMKMGTIASPWRYDALVRNALQLGNLRLPSILRYAADRARSRGGGGYPSTAAMPSNPLTRRANAHLPTCRGMADGLEWAAGVTPQEMADVILAYRNAMVGAAGGGDSN